MKSYTLILLSLVLIQSYHCFAQINGSERRYVSIGSLQSYYTAYGAERAWNGSYYEGLIWPADYPDQDNSVIKRTWFSVVDHTDENGNLWDYKGIYFNINTVDSLIFPMELTQSSKFDIPFVIVNDVTNNNPDYIDTINPFLIADRVITNIVNTSIGLTYKREILVFSQQYHDNYFIKIFTFSNTGNTDYDDEIELTDSLRALRIGWGTRYSVCRDGANTMTVGTQRWGKHTWISRRGEDYVDHIGEIFDESNPIQNWLRAGFCFLGQNETTLYSTIGGPHVTGNGRLASPQHAGTVILHVPVSATDQTDDPNQPTVLGWHAGDTYPGWNTYQLYQFLGGIPYGTGTGGSNRMDETYMTDYWVDPSSVHGDIGGTNLWTCYGPFNLAHGDSIVIVEAEGINGLNRQMCEMIGARWKQAYEDPNDLGPFDLPDGSTTDNKDIYKNEWVFTGKDSILLTFGRAKRNYDNSFNIPQPPEPPMYFEVRSGSDHINLSWAPSDSEDDVNFVGYRIYRAVNNPDTVYSLIAESPAGTTTFNDYDIFINEEYYYYIEAYTDGSLNTSGIINPVGSLKSNKFFTKTNLPVILYRVQTDESDTEISSTYRIFPNYPNPFNPVTTINYYLSEAGNVRLGIYDILGRQVMQLTDDFQEAGYKSVQWDATNVPSGMYFYQIRVHDPDAVGAGEYVQTRKMVLLK